MARSGHRRTGIAATVLFTGFAAAFLSLAGMAPAAAQAPGCEKIKSFLDERKSLVGAINNLNKKGGKLNAKEACGAFGKLTGNGDATLKWMDANKTWCQIPPQFIEGIKTDNDKAQTIRGKACKVAAQQTDMEKKARASSGPPGPGQLGGSGLTGEMKVPKGAL